MLLKYAVKIQAIIKIQDGAKIQKKFYIIRVLYWLFAANR